MNGLLDWKQEDIKWIKYIGGGFTAQVYEIEYTSPKRLKIESDIEILPINGEVLTQSHSVIQTYACKVVQKQNSKLSCFQSYDFVSSEIENQFELEHPNIVKFIGYLENDDSWYLFYEKGNLDFLDFMNKNGKIEDSKVIKYAEQLSSALMYLKEKEILHHDINLQNLIYFKETDQLKLTDFGLSVSGISSEMSSKKFGGTKYYVAPEMFKTKSADWKTEVFSFGVCLYAMLYNKFPNQKKVDFDVLTVSELKNLITKMIQKDPKERINIEEVDKILKDLKNEIEN